MDVEAADNWMQEKVDAWFLEIKASLDNREITNLAYEARDLEEVAEAMRELADELADLGHTKAAGMTDVAARATEMAADRIGAIDGE